jgi:hypothetical protein
MDSPKNPHVRAAIEIGFIIFLFYANLLMGEFTARAARDKTMLAAVADVVTLKNFAIAVVASVVGHFGFEVLRKRA